TATAALKPPSRLHNIMYLMGVAVEESSDGVSTQYILSKKNTPLDGAVSVQLDMWADLESVPMLADSDAFDAAAFRGRVYAARDHRCAEGVQEEGAECVGT
ncbi:hypothetical protein HDU81_000293, partial [Chytriomyces hyalinus]